MFDDTNLFEVTKFSGYDRIETGTRANVGLQYTFQSNDGGYARILAGESYHLAGRNPYTDPGRRSRTALRRSLPTAACRPTAPTTCSAPMSRPGASLQLISQSRFDQSSFDICAVRMPAPRSTLGPFSCNAVYAYLSDDPTNLDIAGGRARRTSTAV